MWGVQDCTYAIDFNLKDINPKSDRYGEEYGLYYSEKTDVILVGLYMADSEDSKKNAQKQQELGQELMDMGYTVKNVAINYYAPLSCVLKGECVNYWWTNPLFFVGNDNCAGYVSGCSPSDEALGYAKWQALLADQIDLPIFQDVAPGWVWDEFGGLQGDYLPSSLPLITSYPLNYPLSLPLVLVCPFCGTSGDLFVYDREGRLYRYLCNIANVGSECLTPMVGGGLQSNSGYLHTLFNHHIIPF